MTLFGFLTRCAATPQTLLTLVKVTSSFEKEDVKRRKLGYVTAADG